MMNKVPSNPLRSIFCAVTAGMLLASQVVGQLYVPSLPSGQPGVDISGALELCARHGGYLASPADLHRAATMCGFATCQRGWLNDGEVWVSNCMNTSGVYHPDPIYSYGQPSLNAIHQAFCSNPPDKPCGEPPALPNTLLHTQSSPSGNYIAHFICVPGFSLSRGSHSFSLNCDTCGEWLGFVQPCLLDDPSQEDPSFKVPSFMPVESELHDISQREINRENVSTLRSTSAEKMLHLPEAQSAPEDPFVQFGPKSELKGEQHDENQEMDFSNKDRFDVEGTRLTEEEVEGVGGTREVTNGLSWMDGYVFLEPEEELLENKKHNKDFSRRAEHGEQETLELTKAPVEAFTTPSFDVLQGTSWPEDVKDFIPEWFWAPTKATMIEQASHSDESDPKIVTDARTYPISYYVTPEYSPGINSEELIFKVIPTLASPMKATSGSPTNDVSRSTPKEVLPDVHATHDSMEGDTFYPTFNGCNASDCEPNGYSTIIAIVVTLLCVLVLAIVLGVWLHKKKQQQSSAYSFNGKDLSGQNEDIEMQQNM
uniref:sushi domain-containing protein 5-like n=1 Tax=Myxine glutinosa TaxID=7769 RepID=UPI00358E0B85